MRLQKPRWKQSWLQFARWGLVLGGLAALGYTGYVYADAEWNQRYDSWVLDQELQGRSATVSEFLRDATPLKKVLAEPGDTKARANGSSKAAAPDNGGAPASDRSLIGRIEIPRLNLRAVVREGDDDRTLRRAVGHLPSSPMPGRPGNVALAGHRDTFFRGLKGIRKNDKIAIRTLDGNYQYQVESIKIVQPDDVHVLAPTPDHVLTLVTCYPFNYVGDAPKRYIVRARQLNVEASASPITAEGDAHSVGAAQ